jgi:predicted DNA-binding WGR domain protein
VTIVIRQRWERHTRYYEAYLHQDLWGNWVLTRIWGGRGQATGQVRHQPCPSYAAGIAALERVGHRRRQRGYTPVRCER